MTSRSNAGSAVHGGAGRGQGEGEPGQPIQIFLTRPHGRNGQVPDQLRACGMAVHELPALELRPLPPPEPLPLPREYDAVVFVSRYAAHCYLEFLTRSGTEGAHWPRHTVAATVGAASAAALRDSGAVPAECIVHPSADAPAQDSEALMAVLDARRVPLHRVLIVRGTQGRDWLARTLTQRGATVDFLPVYERVPAAWSAEMIQKVAGALRTPQACVFLLTSGEGVHTLAARFRELGMLAQWPLAGFVAIHERIGATLQSVLAMQPGTPSPRIEFCTPDDDSIVRTIRAVSRQAAKP